MHFHIILENFKESQFIKVLLWKDYHIVVKDMLQKICNYISSKIDNFEYKIFADNGPLVDRYLAYLSGIGYFGINNNIITDKYGSYVFIGYIISNYEFKTDNTIRKNMYKMWKMCKILSGKCSFRKL